MISTTIQYRNNAGILVHVISPFNAPTELLKKKKKESIEKK